MSPAPPFKEYDMELRPLTTNINSTNFAGFSGVTIDHRIGLGNARMTIGRCKMPQASGEYQWATGLRHVENINITPVSTTAGITVQVTNCIPSGSGRVRVSATLGASFCWMAVGY